MPIASCVYYTLLAEQNFLMNVLVWIAIATAHLQLHLLKKVI